VAIWFFEAEAYFFRDTALDDSLLYLATSRFLAGRLTSLFGIEAEVVAPFIDQDRYRVPHQGSRVLFVNPVREKGVEIAFSLAQRRPSIPFTFVESWGISEQWRKNCFGRALQSGNVEWVIRTMDIGPVLDRTRVLLVPRASEEGFCRLVTEAQLGGIPVLAAKRGNLTENVGAGGTTVDLDADTDVWLESLDRFFDDADFYARTSEQARRHAMRTDTSGAQIIERLLQLLTTCIERYRARRFGSLR
jgi:glycosyltransferase involved in cell wall biosynthesis